MGCQDISLKNYEELKKQALAIKIPESFWSPKYITLSDLSYN